MVLRWENFQINTGGLYLEDKARTGT